MSNGMPPMDELLKQLSGKLNTMNQARDRATPQQARTIADDSSAYPWLKADVRTALSLSNAPVAVKNSVAQSAAQAALKAGAAHVTDAVKGVTSKLNTKSHFSWSSPGDLIRTSSRYTTGALMAPLEMASNMIGAQLGVLNKYAPKTGPLSHGATMPWNPLAPVIAGGNALIHGKGGSFIKDMAKTEKHAIWDTTFGAEGTTLASAVNQPFAAQGHGYFMSQQVAEAQGQKAKEIRGTTPGGRAWTMGRYLGQDLINSHLVKDENAGAYNVVSGLTDMAATWY